MKRIAAIIAAALMLATGIWASDSYKEVTRNSYEATATEYEANTQKMLPETKARDFLSHIPPSAKILDLGCGPGRDAKYFVQEGYSVTGVDISPKMIELAKKAVPGADFQVMDIEDLDLPANHFDAVWACASLLHVSKESLPGVIGKLKECLKEDGILYISMKKGSGEELKPDSRYGGVEKFWNLVQEEELIGLLRSGGLEVMHMETQEQSTSYQTHPWISVISRKPTQRATAAA